MKAFFLAVVAAFLFAVVATAADCGCQARPAAKPAAAQQKTAAQYRADRLMFDHTATVVVHAVAFPRLHAVVWHLTHPLGGRLRR